MLTERSSAYEDPRCHLHRLMTQADRATDTESEYQNEFNNHHKRNHKQAQEKNQVYQ